jgi:hypothetical protein
LNFASFKTCKYLHSSAHGVLFSFTFYDKTSAAEADTIKVLYVSIVIDSPDFSAAVYFMRTSSD